MAVSPYSVEVLRSGYSSPERSGCSLTLVSGPEGERILVDTGGPWEAGELCRLLAARGLSSDRITMVICTHGHVDHVGNLSMFAATAGMMIVGCDIAQPPDRFLAHDFRSGIAYELNEFARVVHTPGHSSDDVTVLVRTGSGPLFEALREPDEAEITVAIAGDLFESETDFDDGGAQWTSKSSNPELQVRHRRWVMRKAQAIVPGHGAAFRVRPELHRAISVEEA